MLHLPSLPSSRLWRRRGSALLHGRALDLPPSPLALQSMEPHTDRYPIVAALRPFQRHLYRQRVRVMIGRLMVLAALVAAATLALRIMGLPLSLPAAPLGAAAAVLVAGLCALPWQAPSIQQLAHEIDRRLGLREQIASALEFEREDAHAPMRVHAQGRDGALLRQRALTAAAGTLRAYTPAGLLPGPSLRREASALCGLTILVALAALVAAHTPLPRPDATVAGARRVSASGRHDGLSRRTLHTGSVAMPMKILSIGSVSPVNGAHPVAPKGRAGSGAPVATGAKGGQPHGANGTRLVLGKGSAQGNNGPTAAGSGTPGRSQKSGAQGTTGSGARSAGTGTQLRLSSGRNSDAGGVESPQQRALKDLRNSIQSAQAQANRGAGAKGANSQGSAGSSSGAQGANNGANTGAENGQRASSTSGAGRKGTGQGTGRHGTGRAGAGGKSGSRGQVGQSNGQSNNPNASDGPAGLGQTGQGSRGAQDGQELIQRNGQAGGGRGADHGATGLQATKSGGRAALANGGDITLNGASGQGGGLVFSVGQPSRTAGTGGSAPSGGVSGAAVSVPGYVAPDSNSITPDDRGVVQGYFTPSSQ